jgi:uncharacterized protein (TIGR03790 family)
MPQAHAKCAGRGTRFLGRLYVRERPGLVEWGRLSSFSTGAGKRSRRRLDRSSFAILPTRLEVSSPYGVVNEMKRGSIVFSVLLLSACAAGTSSNVVPPVPSGQTSAQEALLVINDSSPTSISIGENYSELRHVTNVVHVRCIDSALKQDNETIGYADFKADIETPIHSFLQQHAKINYIVLTKGIPIRVQGAKTGEGYGGPVRASLDGTLAALDYDTIPGAVKVRFDDPSGFAVGTAWLNRYWNQPGRFSHAQFGGYLVTRLDGYTLRDARALTERALAAESKLGGGDILLDIEPDFGLGKPGSEPAPIPTALITQESSYDTWNADMEHAGKELRARGVPVNADVTTHFVGHTKNLLGYFSWGSNDDHFSQRAYNTLGFAPGAIGDTAVSTSARSFFIQSGGQSMIADLITQGITGVKGYTDEPLLQAVSSPTIVLDRFTRGYTLAESFYAGSHFVGWTDVIVGDALAQPYAKRQSK